MKVQLIVIRGKPEGKVIPLAGPKFKIGRGEGCHLRPNSDQVSREHAQFIVEDGAVMVQDLKSRNGTQVNGKTIAGSVQLKDRDLVQVGPLTFAVSIQGAPAAAKPAAAAPAPGKPAAAPAPKTPAAPAAQERSAPEDVLSEDIDSWLVGAPSESSSEIPTTVYGGETVTISTYQGNADASSGSADDEEDEDEDELEDEEEEEDDEDEDELEDEDEEEDEDEAPVDEFIDESNPFYAAKKAQQQAGKSEAKGGGSANQQFQDTSGAASEILKKLMERRRASR